MTQKFEMMIVFARIGTTTLWVMELPYSVSQNKGSPNKKKYYKYLSLFMDTVFYMILTYVMSTVIDQKIIEFEILVFA